MLRRFTGSLGFDGPGRADSPTPSTTSTTTGQPGTRPPSAVALHRPPSLTYRLQGIPARYESPADVALLLISIHHDLGPISKIKVLSLASDLSPYVEKKTATVMFGETPLRFQDGREQWSLELPGHGYEREFLTIDTHFLGFTVLNEPKEGMYQADCFALSGLASHPFGSWRSPSEPHFMWLRDSLPVDLPGVRCIIYGYDTKILSSRSFQSVGDLARLFAAHFRFARGHNQNPRPTMIFCHSLGGIVVKEALVKLASDPQCSPALLSSIKCALFFGVPSQGMQTSYLQTMVNGQANASLIQQLSPGSLELASIEKQFNGLVEFRHIRKISVYETQYSPTAEESSPGHWTMTGRHELLVEPSSAIQVGTLDADQIPIDRTHSGLVKFTPNDASYEIVRQYLSSSFVSQTAPTISLSDELGSAAQIAFQPEPEQLDVSSQAKEDKPTMARSTRGAAQGGRFLTTNHIVETGYKSDRQMREKALLQKIRADHIIGTFWRSAHPSVLNSETLFAAFFNQDLNHLDTALETFRDDDWITPYAFKEAIKTLSAPLWNAFKQCTKDSLVRGLDYDLRDTRERQISEAYPHTFEWAFTDDLIGLKSWLRARGGLFWVSGKPASGKSTLLRWLSRNPQTRSIFATRSGATTKCHLLSFFFHDRGSSAQKSLEGLIQSMLYQIVTAEPCLQDVILPILVKHPPVNNAIWDLDLLQEVLDKVLMQSSVDLSLLLVVDALDEFSGEKEIICRFLQDLTATDKARRTSVSVLASSRPENIIMDEFADVQTVSIHEHTQTDISRFIQGRALEQKHLAQILRDATGTDQAQLRAILDILEMRASGVFLWVSLAIMELNRALQEGTALSDLEAVLNSVPSTLQDFYASILARVTANRNEVLLRDCYCMFETSLREHEPSVFLMHHASKFSLVDVDVSLEPIMASMTRDLLALQNTCNQRTPPGLDLMTRRLKSRTGGLLEITEDWHANRSNYRITFLHQTAKEFTSQTDLMDLFVNRQHIAKYGNGHTFIAKAAIALLATRLKAETFSSELSIDRLRNLAYHHAYMAEQTTGLSLAAFIDQIFAKDSDTWSRFSRRVFPAGQRYGQSSPNYTETPLLFAVVAKLKLTMREKIQNIDVQSVQSLLLSWTMFCCDRQSRPGWDFKIEAADVASITALLVKHAELDKGAEDRLPAWSYLYYDLLQHLRKGFPFDVNLLYSLTQAMLEGGQDPDQHMYLPNQDFGSSRIEYLTAFIVCSFLPAHSRFRMLKLLGKFRGPREDGADAVDAEMTKLLYTLWRSSSVLTADSLA